MTSHAKKKRNMLNIIKKKMNFSKNHPEMIQVTGLADKDTTVFYKFQKLEEIFNMLEMGKIFFNSQIGLQEMITTISEIENTVNRLTVY